jgi:hypothetical protein
MAQEQNSAPALLGEVKLYQSNTVPNFLGAGLTQGKEFPQSSHAWLMHLLHGYGMTPVCSPAERYKALGLHQQES